MLVWCPDYTTHQFHWGVRFLGAAVEDLNKAMTGYMLSADKTSAILTTCTAAGLLPSMLGGVGDPASEPQSNPRFNLDALHRDVISAMLLSVYNSCLKLLHYSSEWVASQRVTSSWGGTSISAACVFQRAGSSC
jgi:hypothetical protein